jgi:phosphoglycolate phosphatase
MLWGKDSDVTYKLIIFDFDGTLADSFPWFVQVFDTLAERYRFKRLAEQEGATLRGMSARQIIQHLGIPTWKLPLIARHARMLAKRDRAQIALFPGVDTMLAQLQAAGIRLAVVSSNSEDTVRHVLGPENAVRITYYACGSSIFGKQAHFRRVLKRSGVRPANALCIGDEIRDYEAATAVGMPFGAVAWGYTTIEALTACAPAAVFHQVEEIVGHLTRNSEEP